MNGPNPELLQRVNDVLRRRSGTSLLPHGELKVRCLEPDHDDRNPSAGWSTRKGCGGCRSCDASWSTRRAAELLGLDYPTNSARARKGGKGSRSRGRPTANPRRPGKTWEIRNRAGQVVALHRRVDKPDGTKDRVWWERAGGEKGLCYAASALPLYGAELLDTYDKGQPLYITEGEKAADGARALGLQAVGTVTGAASCPDAETLRDLDGFNVRLWPDHDGPGWRHARAVGRALLGLDISVQGVVDTAALWGDDPERGTGQDAADLEALPESLPLRSAGELLAATDGRKALDAARELIGRYVILPSPEALDTATLWVAHTWIVQELETTPRLAAVAPEKGSGKTRLLEVLELIVRNPLRVGSGVTAAALYRVIAAGGDRLPTLLIDEAQAVYRRAGKGDERADAVRAVTNDGYRYGGKALVCAPPNWEPKEFPCFAPVAVAGLGNFLPDDTRSRSIVIRMQRRAPHERVAPFRLRTATAEADPIREALESCADAVIGRVNGTYPKLPDGVVDRPADVWEPLLVVAELAGGDWPERARAACVHFTLGSREADADAESIGAQLLADLRELFGERRAVATSELVEKLNADPERPWEEWRHGQGIDPRSLAKLLRRYDNGRGGPIRSKTVKLDGGDTAKGYHVDDLRDPWERYLPVCPSPPSPPNNGGQRRVTQVTEVTPTRGPGDPETDPDGLLEYGRRAGWAEEVL